MCTKNTYSTASQVLHYPNKTHRKHKEQANERCHLHLHLRFDIYLSSKHNKAVDVYIFGLTKIEYRLDTILH